MNSACIRTGVAVGVNGVAASFLAYTLFSDGADFYVGANRTYLALLLVAPMLIVLLLAMPMLHRSVALLGALVALMAATLALAQLEKLGVDRTVTPAAMEAAEGKLASQ
jgi:hypothetical protein